MYYINRAPPAAVTVDAALTGQPVVNVQDQYLNNVPSASVAASITGGGTGTFTTGDTTTETSDANGNATFTNLGYTKVDSFTLSFTSNGHTAVSGALNNAAGRSLYFNHHRPTFRRQQC